MEHELLSITALVMVGEAYMFLRAKHSLHKKEYGSREGKGKGARPRDGGAADEGTGKKEKKNKVEGFFLGTSANRGTSVWGGGTRRCS